MQKIGQKVKAIAKAKGLFLVKVGEYAGWSKTGFSRKINSGEPFDKKSLTKIAEYLGVKPEFLTDTSRPFNLGDTIPEDAIATPLTPATEATDPVKALIKLAEDEIAHRKRVDAGHGFEVLTEAMARLADEMREMREEFKRMRDADAGDHDDDN